MAENSGSGIKVYVDYSRKDSLFTRRLIDALTGKGFDVWVDWAEIPPAVDWLEQIFRGIEETDIYLLLISPDSLKSEVVNVTLNKAVQNGKRIIPVVIRDVRPEDSPSEVRVRNWLFFRETDDFDASLAKLVAALRTDYEWVSFHRNLQVQALEWHRSKDPGYLLRGRPLREAETFLATSADKDPRPTDLQRAFVFESRNKASLLVRLGFSRGQQPATTKFETKTQSVQTQLPVPEHVELQFVEVGKQFSVSTDQASGADQLNYARFADAFATLIQNPEAKTPITIGVYGQWGSGKSFLMKKIIEALKNDPSDVAKTWLGRTIRNFVQLFRKGTDQKVDTVIIEFNAWVYSGSEHLWASLVTHLYREIERHFGVEMHFYRLSKAIRGFVPKTIGVFLFYGVLGLALSALVGFDNMLMAWQNTHLALQAVTVSLVGGSLFVTFPVLWNAVREFGNTLFISQAVNLQNLAARPDFRNQIGIMADIKAEIGFIGRILETRNKRQQTRVVLFVDDLDRCAHRKAVEVLQAIMLLLADQDGSPFVIFLGIDARVIVRAVEEHYGDILVKAGINGYEYLDKIVQIPFVIPLPNLRDIRNYIESLVWTKVEKELVESKFALKPEERKIESSWLVSEDASESPESEKAEVSFSPSTEEPDSKIPTEAVPVTFTKPEREALKQCVDDIVDNPRKIKRIVNIYRFVRLLLPPNFQEHKKIIRWILLTEQWPLHAAWIIEEIENDYFLDGKLRRKQNATIMDVYRRVKDNIYSDDMDALITIDADPILFSQYIQKEPAFTVQEIYNVLYPLTFNLNPAIKSEISKYMARMAENYIQTKKPRKPRNHKNPTEMPETESATLKKAIQEIIEIQPK